MLILVLLDQNLLFWSQIPITAYYMLKERWKYRKNKHEEKN